MNTELVTTEPPASLAVALPENPATLMRQATDVAGLCKAIVLSTACNIQGRKYVKCEGWMAIATAHGCIASSRDVKKVEGGWTAIGEIRRISDGVLLSQAEGFVGTGEKRWGQADEYACRAMAQTRAISRACRAAFAHVVVMMDAGLSTTPAEEVPDGGFKDALPASPAPVSSTAAPQPKVWTPADWLAWLMVQCTPHPAEAGAVFQEHGLLAAGEPFDSLKLDKLTGWTGADVKKLAADVAARAAADNQIPGAEAPTEGQGAPASAPAQKYSDRAGPDGHPDEIPPPGLPPGCQSKQITVKRTSVKHGLKGSGKPYTRYGICSEADEWFNTFSNSIAAQATEGQSITVWFTTSTYGNDLHAIT